MTLFNSEAYGSFTAGILVDWNHEKRVNKLHKLMKKDFKKHIKGIDISNNRINTFVVSSVSFKKDISKDQRKELELQLHKRFERYSKELFNTYRNNSDHFENEKVYTETFKSYDIEYMNSLMNENRTRAINNVETMIEHLIGNAFVCIWDLHHNESSKIILKDRVIKIPNGDKNNHFEITSIIDELIITNFGLNFLPFSDNLIHNMDLLCIEYMEFLDKFDNKVDKRILPMLRNFIGVLSGLQENIKLFRRQLSRVIDILQSTMNEFSNVYSNDLKTWIENDVEGLSNFSTEKLNRLDNKLVGLKEKLRAIVKNNYEKSTDIVFLTEFFKKTILLKAEVGALILWIHRFEDIPSFTTMDSGIAFERVEKEIYTPIYNEAILETNKLFKMYRRGNSSVYVLRGVDMKIDKGEFVVIRGPSGSGKTTLLNLLSGLDDADRGAVFFNNENLLAMKDSRRTRIRRDHYGFIFQNYALIPHLTAYENTRLPLDLSGLSKELQSGILDLLKDVGIGEYANNRPALLSGGQMQRLGIARALIAKPDVIFADEPTGDLDIETAVRIMDLLKKYHEETGITIVLVTHNKDFVRYGDREIYIKDGQIIKN